MDEVESLRRVAGHLTYAQAHQDLFVRAMLDFKTDGCYVEIGSAEPMQSNNTYILERDLGWRGISLELDERLVDEFRQVRRNPCISADATTCDFRAIFAEHQLPARIDYLSVDIDPAETTLRALQRLPHDAFRFSVLTFEHDNYVSGPEVMELSRQFLADLGYARVVSNVMVCGRDFEDWYVDPQEVPAARYEPFVCAGLECADVFRNGMAEVGGDSDVRVQQLQ